MTKATVKKQLETPGIQKKSSKNLSSEPIVEIEPESIEEVIDIIEVPISNVNFSINPLLLEKMLKIGDGEYWNRVLENFVGDMNRRYRR